MPVLVLEELKPPSLLQLLEPESQRGTRPCFLCPLNCHLDLPGQQYLLILPPKRVLEIPASSRHCHLHSQTQEKLGQAQLPAEVLQMASGQMRNPIAASSKVRHWAWPALLALSPLSSSSSCLHSPAKLLPLQGLCTSHPGVLSGGLRSLWCTSLLSKGLSFPATS